MTTRWKMPKNPLNALELHFYASIPYYENLLTEENTKRF